MKIKISLRTVIFAIIIIICIFSINFGVYWEFFRDKDELENTIIPDEQIDKIAKDFKTIFENRLDYQEYDVNITGITKINSKEDLIYTWVSKESKIDNAYELKLNIPRVNISNTAVERFNEKIKELYVNKANDIIRSKSNAIYTVEYMSYINTNILSLVIKSTLKEGNNPQRVIVQTYNYNLSTNEEVTFNQLLEIKGIKESTFENSVLNKVKESNEQAQTLKNLGYNVYIRDTSSDIYKLENTTNFILGENNYLYVIYPYGNSNYTDEMDVVVF